MVNVSHTTVSRALNDSPLIRQETKEKIKAIAEAYNYIPNYNARSLVLAKSYNVGLFFSTLKKGTTAHFFYDVTTGVNNVIKDHYTLTVKGIDDYKNFHLIRKRYFDGIILMSQSGRDDDFISHVIQEEIPIIVLNREINHENVINIISDDKLGAYRATEYLISQGHSRIAIIEGKEEFKTNIQRKQGFCEALQQHQLRFAPELSEKGNYDLESGYQAMRRLLKKDKNITAVFCFNDEMAVGAIKAVADSHLKVPDDISVVGFDDSGYSAFLSPALTTVKRPIEKISLSGARKLLDIVNNKKNLEAEKIFVKTELMVRDSVKKL